MKYNKKEVHKILEVCQRTIKIIDLLVKDTPLSEIKKKTDASPQLIHYYYKRVRIS